jgi:hypothetical protein
MTLEDIKCLHAEVLALEQDVMRLRTEHATYIVVPDYDARLQDLHTRLNTCVRQLARWQRVVGEYSVSR